jgi:hypothetical protein
MCTCREKNFTRSLVPSKVKFNLLAIFRAASSRVVLTDCSAEKWCLRAKKNALIIKGQQLLLITRRSLPDPKCIILHAATEQPKSAARTRRLSAAARSFYGRIMRPGKGRFVIDETLGKTHRAE